MGVRVSQKYRSVTVRKSVQMLGKIYNINPDFRQLMFQFRVGFHRPVTCRKITYICTREFVAKSGIFRREIPLFIRHSYMADFALLRRILFRYQRSARNEFICLANILSFICHFVLNQLSFIPIKKEVRACEYSTKIDTHCVQFSRLFCVHEIKSCSSVALWFLPVSFGLLLPTFGTACKYTEIRGDLQGIARDS